MRTSTTGLPVARSASSIFSCTAGSAMSVRSPPWKPGYETRISSPSTSAVRPPTKTTTSAARAAASASSKGVPAPGSRQARRTSASRMSSKYSSRSSASRPASSATVPLSARATLVSIQESTTGLPSTKSRAPSFAVTTSSYSPDVGGTSTPVQRTANWSPSSAFAASSSPRATGSSVGELRSQRKSTFESTRESIGSPSKLRPRKYSPFEPALGRAGRRPQVRGVDRRRRARVLAPLDEVDAARIEHSRLRRNRAPDPGQQRHRLRRRAVVVAEQRDEVVGRGADHRDRAEVLLQRQDAVVLEQHHRLLRDAPREPIVLGSVVDRVRDLRVAHALGRVEHAELQPRAHQALQRYVDVGFLQQAALERLAERLVDAAALEVAALGHAERRRLLRRRDQLVVLVDVVDRAAVRDHVAGEAPVPPQDVEQQALARRGRLAVHAVVGAHHRLDLALDARGRGTPAGRSRAGRARSGARRSGGGPAPGRCGPRSAWRRRSPGSSAGRRPAAPSRTRRRAGP